MLNFINPSSGYFGLFSKSAAFGLLSILLYVLVYTPLKKFSPLSISIGAIPGAIPFLLGFVAGTDDFELAAGILFAIQFFWQYPHFISIIWVQEEAYKKAGFKMVFGGAKGKFAASISIITTAIMIIISVLPYFYTITNLKLTPYAATIIFCLGIWFLVKSINLYTDCKDTTAKKLMLSSFAYLTIMQTVYVLDKFLIQ